MNVCVLADLAQHRGIIIAAPTGIFIIKPVYSDWAAADVEQLAAASNQIFELIGTSAASVWPVIVRSYPTNAEIRYWANASGNGVTIISLADVAAWMRSRPGPGPDSDTCSKITEFLYRTGLPEPRCEMDALTDLTPRGSG